MKVKTSELTDHALDLAVAKCEQPSIEPDDFMLETWHPSTNWAQGGPIIEREHIALNPCESMDEWAADMTFRQGIETQYGPTPLIAAMRCYVASKLGDEVEIPEELK